MRDRSRNVEDALPPGTRIEEFEIEQALQSGGFGMTYLAQDRSLGRRVAIKEYLPREWGGRRADGTVGPRSASYAADFRWGLARFLEEARTLARLDHPRIVRVYRVIEAWGTAYMVMEYVEGRNLEETLKAEGPWPEERVRALLEELLPGVAQVHAAGLIHRDVKPANVMLRSDGTPVLIDFGSARYAAGAHSHALTSVLTPGYAPHEQYQTKGKQGAWTDVYALGAVAYRALSGQAPAEAAARVGAIAQQQADPLAPVSQAAAGVVSESFAAAVTSALALFSEGRPRDVSAWRAQWDEGAARPVPHRGGSGGRTDAEARPVPKKQRLRGAGRRMAYSAAALAVASVAAVWIASGATYSPVLGRAWSASDADENGWTDLHYAAVLNRPDLVRRLLDAGAEVDARLLDDGERFSERLRRTLRAFGFPDAFDDWNRDGETPLHLAAGYSDSVEVVDLLLDRGAKLEANPNGWTSLHYAARYNASVAVVELLLDRGADLEAANENGSTPLHFAAFDNDSVEVVALLLDRGAALEAVDGDGDTPLHDAAWGNDSEVVDLLLARGADLETVDKAGNTPLHSAAWGNDSVAVVDLLLDRDADLVKAVNNNGETPLHHAAWNNASVGVVDLLLDRDADLEAVTNYGRTPLHNAAWNNASVAVVELLLARGADLEAVTNEGWTPLHNAAWGNDSVAVVELLLKHDADLEAVTRGDETPLHNAAWNNASVEVVALLLDRGANFEAVNYYGDTPLHKAAWNNASVAVVELLLARGAALEAVTEGGHTPLHYAAIGNDSEVVDLLLARGAALEAVTNDLGLTPLHFAARSNSVGVVALLLRRGANLEAVRNDGGTLLHSAARNSDSVAVVELLLRRGAALEAVDQDGNTPLHDAATRCGVSVEIVELLLDRDANLEAVDNDGNTPLHAAAARSVESYCSPVEDLVEVVDLLLARGADPEATNNSGQTPLDVAGTDAVRSALEVAALEVAARGR